LRGALEKSYSLYFNAREISDPRQMWWARLCYNHVQAYVMSEYDNGRSGWSLKHAAIVWIPRFLWPSKPITGNVGTEFGRQFTGRPEGETAVGIGAFGEAYWVGGWLGVILISFFIGAEMSVMSRLVIVHGLRGDALAYLCCFLYGAWTAKSIDKWIIMNYIGGIPMFVGLYVLCGFVQRQTAAHRMSEAPRA
jgi:hypothetical protein